MPITPEDAAKDLDAHHEQALQELYDYIDADLVRRWHTGMGTLTLAVPIIHNKVRKQAIASYESIGWKVTYRHDQRDGPYFIFQKAITRAIFDTDQGK